MLLLQQLLCCQQLSRIGWSLEVTHSVHLSWDFSWLGLVQVLCRQHQLLRVHDCYSHAMSSRQYFQVFLPTLHHSYPHSGSDFVVFSSAIMFSKTSRRWIHIKTQFRDEHCQNLLMFRWNLLHFPNPSLRMYQTHFFLNSFHFSCSDSIMNTGAYVCTFRGLRKSMCVFLYPSPAQCHQRKSLSKLKISALARLVGYLDSKTPISVCFCFSVQEQQANITTSVIYMQMLGI